MVDNVLRDRYYTIICIGWGDKMYRDSFAVVNLKHVKENLELVHSTIKKPLLVVLKADAYGHGYQEIGRFSAQFSYVKMFGVATLKEALDIRALGIKQDILILGSIPLCQKTIDLVMQNNISLTIFSTTYWQEVKSWLTANDRLKVHIKLDTGMGRIGITSKEEFDAMLISMQQACCTIEGVFTHFATADGDTRAYHQQVDTFYRWLDNRNFSYIHCSNSAAMLYHQDERSNLGRVGIAMYGVDPAGNENTALKQVLSLYTRVSMVKKVKAGQKIGYGHTYTAKEDCYIATLPIGYADGIIRQNQGRAVYCNGKYYPIVGRICMDQMMIQVDETVQEKDIVEIFGTHISLATMAKELDTIAYEIMCLLSKRVERIYEK